MFTKPRQFTLRNLDTEIITRLEAMAALHDRSTEAEARHALRLYTTAPEIKDGLSSRTKTVSIRLNAALEQVNATRNYTKLLPSQIAQAINESKAETTENWFSGVDEPSFTQLEAIANFLGTDTPWLQHGIGKMYKINGQRMPEGDTAKTIEWLLDLDTTEKVQRLLLIRESDKTGNLIIIKQYDDWRCKIFFPGIHISEEIGAGGEIALTHLAVVLHILYEFHAKNHNISIKSFLLPTDATKLLMEGLTHPLSLIKSSANEAPWWEDIWDINQFKQQNYWSGWSQLCERIQRTIDLKPRLAAERMQINNFSHPFFKAYLPHMHQEITETGTLRDEDKASTTPAIIKGSRIHNKST